MIKAKAFRLAAGLALVFGATAAPAEAQFMSNYPVIIVPPPPAQNLVLPPKPKPPAPRPDASAQSPAATPDTPAPGQCTYQGKTRVCP